jgi:hypothetical protein
MVIMISKSVDAIITLFILQYLCIQFYAHSYTKLIIASLIRRIQLFTQVPQKEKPSKFLYLEW